MSKAKRTYHSKILLFGEYLAIHQMDVLATPFMKFNGKWNFSSSIDERFFSIMAHFEKEELLFDVTKMTSEVQAGLYFDSSIPNGYGCGSSGALVAAIYDRFFESKQNLHEILNDLKQMENYFHGSSSGIDPLVSLTNKSIYVENQSISSYSIATSLLKNFYLYDSEVSRETDVLVKAYKEKADKYPSLQLELSELNKALIHILVDHTDSRNLKAYMKDLSRLQLEFFDFAIPVHIRNIWKKALDQNVYFKLCGAGGGGYFMAFSMIDHQNLIPIVQN